LFWGDIQLFEDSRFSRERGGEGFREANLAISEGRVSVLTAKNALNRTRFATSTVSGLRGLKSSLKQCAVRMCSAKRLHRTGPNDVPPGHDEQEFEGYMTEEGSREALTAGGARVQARKQIAAYQLHTRPETSAGCWTHILLKGCLFGWRANM
jgi:hypothetical protein